MFNTMALNKDKNLKLYFSISEVAQMFDVNESTLRFWEKEFDQIRPRKTGKGTRSYRQEDIDAIRLVYHLVKERGMTLAGARQKLKENPETWKLREESSPYCRFKAVSAKTETSGKNRNMSWKHMTNTLRKYASRFSVQTASIRQPYSPEKNLQYFLT